MITRKDILHTNTISNATIPTKMIAKLSYYEIEETRMAKIQKDIGRFHLEHDQYITNNLHLQIYASIITEIQQNEEMKNNRLSHNNTIFQKSY